MPWQQLPRKAPKSKPSNGADPIPDHALSCARCTRALTAASPSSPRQTARVGGIHLAFSHLLPPPPLRTYDADPARQPDSPSQNIGSDQSPGKKPFSATRIRLSRPFPSPGRRPQLQARLASARSPDVAVLQIPPAWISQDKAVSDDVVRQAAGGVTRGPSLMLPAAC